MPTIRDPGKASRTFFTFGSFERSPVGAFRAAGAGPDAASRADSGATWKP